MVMHLAQVVDTVKTVGDNTTLLGSIMTLLLGGGLLAGYRFVVNFRKTERGMAKARIREANAGERAAQREASLWQARCGDLEYLLRGYGVAVPPLSKELRALVLEVDTAAMPPIEEEAADEETGRTA
ncbi:MAG: hypothetical protein HOY78_02350 [Saccharothrix sp.]|nr:hypothetical protein [Saccharothrix sp.]